MRQKSFSTILIVFLFFSLVLYLPAQTAGSRPSLHTPSATSLLTRRVLLPLPQSFGAIGPIGPAVSQSTENGKHNNELETIHTTARLLHEALQIELAAYGLTVITPDGSEDDGFIDITAIDFSFLCAFSESPRGRLVIALSVADPEGKTHYFGRVRQADSNLTLFNVIRTMVAEIIPPALEAKPLPTLKESLLPPLLSISRGFISSDDGAEIRPAGLEWMGMVKEGQTESLYYPLLEGTYIPYEVRKQNYRTLRDQALVVPKQTKVQLEPLVPKTHLAGTFSWSSSRQLGAGLGLRYYPLPDWVFLGLEHYFFIASRQDEYLYPAFSETNGLVICSDTRLLAGSYIIAPPESRIRLGLAGALQLHASYFSGDIDEAEALEAEGPLYIDYSVNFFTIWLEYELSWFVPYVQMEFVYVLDKKNSLVPAGGRRSFTTGILLPWNR